MSPAILFPEKVQKRTVSSNSLRSTNEAVRTGGPVRTACDEADRLNTVLKNACAEALQRAIRSPDYSVSEVIARSRRGQALATRTVLVGASFLGPSQAIRSERCRDAFCGSCTVGRDFYRCDGTRAEADEQHTCSLASGCNWRAKGISDCDHIAIGR
jgi:hypothetical protein